MERVSEALAPETCGTSRAILNSDQEQKQCSPVAVAALDSVRSQAFQGWFVPEEKRGAIQFYKVLFLELAQSAGHRLP
jgi:hypothetical protein